MILAAMLTHRCLHKNVAILLALAGFFVTFSANVSAQELTSLQNATTDQINVAKDYWVYAAISNNVYNDHIQIGLPKGWFRVDSSPFSLSGFYAETFVKKQKAGSILEIVVAYRGTNDLVDWTTGNTNNIQQGYANEYASKIIAKYNKLDVPLKFTGHSLGGALAQNVANNLQRQAIVFDTSPMNGFNYGTSAESIVSIHEYAEALTLLRIFQRSDMAVYNFIDSINPLTNHDMYPLANGMKALALASSHINSNSNTQSNGTSNTPASTPPITTQTSSAGADCVSSTGNKTTGLSGAEAAKVLGTTKEYNRLSAIQQMASNNSICSPLSAGGAKLILQGTTSGAREGSISSLAKLIKDKLTGEEVATILGGVNELAEYNRLGGITSLAQAGRMGVIGTDAALFLKGASGGAREASIANIAKSVKPNLTGEEIATILGGVNELAEYNRLGGITSLANSGKLKSSYTGDEMAAMLQGTSGGARTGSIATITKAR